MKILMVQFNYYNYAPIRADTRAPTFRGAFVFLVVGIGWESCAVADPHKIMQAIFVLCILWAPPMLALVPILVDIN